MSAIILCAVLTATPLGACADRALCRFKLSDEPALKEALNGLSLTAGELKVEPLKRPGGDVAFGLTMASNGREVVVKVVSLHRKDTLYGEARAKVMAVSRPEWKERALVSAARVAIPRALEDLAGQISGVRKVTLSAQVSGLDLKAREHVERSLLPCLKSLFDLVGPVTSAEAAAGYLDESLEYLPAKDEPRASLDWQVSRMKSAMLGGVRSKCAVSGSPLQGWSTFVTSDVLNGAVVVSWKR